MRDLPAQARAAASAALQTEQDGHVVSGYRLVPSIRQTLAGRCSWMTAGCRGCRGNTNSWKSPVMYSVLRAQLGELHQSATKKLRGRSDPEGRWTKGAVPRLKSQQTAVTMEGDGKRWARLQSAAGQTPVLMPQLKAASVNYPPTIWSLVHPVEATSTNRFSVDLLTKLNDNLEQVEPLFPYGVYFCPCRKFSSRMNSDYLIFYIKTWWQTNWKRPFWRCWKWASCACVTQRSLALLLHNGRKWWRRHGNQEDPEKAFGIYNVSKHCCGTSGSEPYDDGSWSGLLFNGEYWHQVPSYAREQLREQAFSCADVLQRWGRRFPGLTPEKESAGVPKRRDWMRKVLFLLPANLCIPDPPQPGVWTTRQRLSAQVSPFPAWWQAHTSAWKQLNVSAPLQPALSRPWSPTAATISRRASEQIDHPSRTLIFVEAAHTRTHARSCGTPTLHTSAASDPPERQRKRPAPRPSPAPPSRIKPTRLRKSVKGFLESPPKAPHVRRNTDFWAFFGVFFLLPLLAIQALRYCCQRLENHCECVALPLNDGWSIYDRSTASANVNQAPEMMGEHKGERGWRLRWGIQTRMQQASRGEARCSCNTSQGAFLHLEPHMNAFQEE